MSELVFETLEAFAAIDEPGAEPLGRATAGGTVIPAGGLVLVFGSGGAGKSTLVVDLCFALAAGVAWLDAIEPARKLNVTIIENEGPRPMLREKFRQKLEQTCAELGGRVRILADPWSRFTFADDTQRRALAWALGDQQTDLLVVGPLSRVGMEGGGTLDDIGKFVRLIADVRDQVAHPFAVLLIHHENRVGQVSGAWEAEPDTVAHVSSQGNGRTRLYWQKVRWSSALHATSTNLVWADGESFTVEEKPEITDDTMADELLEAVRENPGASWSKIRDTQTVRGKAVELAKVRDRLIAAGTLINSAARDGYFNLWHHDDPAAPRSPVGTAQERLPDPPPAGASEPSRSPVPYVSRNGVGNGTAGLVDRGAT
jgi:hypothetical protein